MFDNIGGKIKGLAVVTTVIGFIASFIYGCTLIGDGGFLIMVIGFLASWIGSFLLYGFGQLVENSDTLVKLALKKEGVDVPLQGYAAAFVQQSRISNPPATAWNCSYCGEPQLPGAKFCARCGAARPEQAKPSHPETWTCVECNTVNLWRVGQCNGCGTTKAWSEAKRKEQ